MEIIILKEKTLSDDLLLMPSEGKVFNGNYIAIIKKYVYLNEWSDREEVRRFRSEKQLKKYLSKNYPKLTI
jgi:hypothetical protein